MAEDEYSFDDLKKDLGDAKSGAEQVADYAKTGVETAKDVIGTAKEIQDIISGKKSVPDGFMVARAHTGLQEKSVIPDWMYETKEPGEAGYSFDVEKYKIYANQILYTLWSAFAGRGMELTPSLLNQAAKAYSPYAFINVPPGTPLSDMTVAQQMKYFTNEAMIAAMQNWQNPVAMGDAVGAVGSQANDTLGAGAWIWMQGRNGGQLPRGAGRVAQATVNPGEVINATRSGTGNGGALSTDGASVEGGLPGAECLVPSVPYGEQRSQCVDNYAAQQPNVRQKLLQAGYDNIKSIADPKKAAQYIHGIDGKPYFVVGKGARFAVPVLWLGVGVAAVGGAAAWWFLRDDSGKKRKRKKKR